MKAYKCGHSSEHEGQCRRCRRCLNCCSNPKVAGSCVAKFNAKSDANQKRSVTQMENHQRKLYA